ncbi:MAG TPA: hypothetical protein VGK25_10920 [Ignavibacteria bacterium]|jgi:hypothetical protein
MKFKKDYINYLLFKAIYEGNGNFKDDLWLRNIADKIISVDDIVKLTYLVGKTAGLESLFKYLLYISDKIDKSHVSIFNLKDNFEYDLRNLKKIIQNILDYRSHKFEEKIEIAERVTEQEITEEDRIKIDISDEKISGTDEDTQLEELAPEDQKGGMTLIENYDDSAEGEVFELESISETIEKTDSPDNQPEAEEETITEDKPEEVINIKEEIPEEPDTETAEPEMETIEENEDKIIEDESDEIAKSEESEPLHEDAPGEIEIIVKKPSSSEIAEGQVKEESVTNEAYYAFETKFFEEVKILEKLFATVDKQCKKIASEKLSEKTLQSLTEIIEITSELSNLSRQLMFDLIADVFLTMNLYFTKAISNPEIIESEKIKLFDSALALVNSLIKGEDYLNYDVIVDKLEKLKKQLRGTDEKTFEEEPVREKIVDEIEKAPEPEQILEIEEEPDIIKPQQINADSALFKLKYIVKEFEKSFLSISGFKGEYSRFEALEKINELNHALRLIAKIASNIKLNDVLKLAEVTYVFLKYLKDYRMDLLEPEIQQIVKYVIFTFKMLLTNRKPDDFNVLVQHLNNPVKIFADS